MDDFERALKVAATYVGARMLTCKELYDRLIRKKFDKNIAERVVTEYVAAGILDDREYAKLYVSEAVRISGKGMYRIKQELFKKGIAGSIIDDVMKDSDEDTYKALFEYVESHRLLENIASRKELEKVQARLIRRGFSLSEIKKCVEEFNVKFEEE